MFAGTIQSNEFLRREARIGSTSEVAVRIMNLRQLTYAYTIPTTAVARDQPSASSSLVSYGRMLLCLNDSDLHARR